MNGVPLLKLRNYFPSSKWDVRNHYKQIGQDWKVTFFFLLVYNNLKNPITPINHHRWEDERWRVNATVCGQLRETECSLGAVWDGGRDYRWGPGLASYCWLGLAGRGVRGSGWTRKHLTPKARAAGGEGGVTVHFPCRLGVGVRASEICTPTQEEMGLRFDIKPPSWCLIQFPKMAAHLLGRGIRKKITAKISGLELKQGLRRDSSALSI